MKKIQIFTSAGSESETLEKNTRNAVSQLGLQIDIEKVEDKKQFKEYGVKFAPALAVDGHIRLSGRVATVDEIKRIISQ